MLEGGSSWFTQEYNQRGLLRRVNSSYSELLKSASFDAEGLATQMVYGDAASTTASFGYDGRNRLQSYAVSRTAPGLWNTATPTYTVPPTVPNGRQLSLVAQTITLDDMGDPTAITDAATASQWPAGAKPMSRTVTYDAQYRARQTNFTYAGETAYTAPFAAEIAANDRAPVPIRSATSRVGQQTVTYDWKGNITQWTDNLNFSFDRSLGSPGYDALRPHQMVSATGITAGYDEAGYMVDLRVARATGTCSAGSASMCAQHFRYDWDEVGQLQRARRWDYSRSVPTGNPSFPGTPTATAAFDMKYAYSDGQRVLKESVGSADPYTLEVFDTLRLNGARMSGGEYTRSTGTETAYLGGIGRLVYSTALPSPSGNPRHVFLTLGDHLGSTSVVIDRESAEVVEKASYMAYGAIESDYRPTRWKTFREQYKYTGKEEDIEVGLTYFGARYYHPRLGRFISADPLTIHTGAGDLNPYAYVRGRVFSHVDPWGFDGCRMVGKENVCDVTVVGRPREPASSSDSSGGSGQAIDPALLAMGSAGEGPPSRVQPRGAEGPSASSAVQPSQHQRGPTEALKDFALMTAFSFAHLIFNSSACRLFCSQDFATPTGQYVDALSASHDDESAAYKATWAAATVLTMPLAGEELGEVKLATGLPRTMAAVEGVGAAEIGASSSMNGALLRRQLISAEIAGGHAFDKHVVAQGEFPGIASREQFAQHIESFLGDSSTMMRNLSNGRSAFWNGGRGEVLIRNPIAKDGGTFFRPTAGEAYFWKLK